MPHRTGQTCAYLEWLEPRQHAVIAVAGSGGKTSTVLRIASEARDAGLRVAVSCTTKMRPTEILPRSRTILSLDPKELAEGMDESFDAGQTPFLFAGTTGDGKRAGLPPEVIDEIAPHADLMVIEADGAKGLPLKFPAEHEPVVPSSSTMLLVVAGASAIGKRAGPETVFRLELARGLVEQGTELTPAAIVPLLHADNGYLRFARPGLNIAFLVNQADAADPEAVESLCYLLGHGHVCTVAAGSTSAASSPLRIFDNKRGTVAAVVLAAGESKRYGSNKLVADHRGRPLVSHAVDAAIGSEADSVFVVTGHESQAVRAAIGEKPDVNFVLNEEFRSGMASSLKAGVRAAHGFDSVMVIPGDMPRLTVTIADAVIRAWRECSAPLCNAVANGRRAHPVLFRRELFSELLGISGDEGGRSVVARHANRAATVALEDDSSQADVDRREDHGLP